MSHFFDRFSRVILPAIVLAHTIFFLLFWLTNSLFYSSTNDYLTNMLGTRQDYIKLCLLASAVIGMWCISRILFYRTGHIHRLSALTAGLFALISLIYIAFFYGSFSLLLKESPVQLPRIGQMLLYYRILLDPILLICATLLGSLAIRSYLIRQKAADKKVALLPIAFLLGGLALLWALPLAFNPDSVYHGSLPIKPLIIAHRGASMLAPENTLASANLAAGKGVYGLETDVHISRDGFPFLMHDDTLARTTNAEILFPDRAKDRAENFTLAEIGQLNAGNWFIEQDPFASISDGYVNSSQLEEYAKQSIPTLAEELNVVRQHKLVLIFDLKQPPDDHPYNQSFFDITLHQLKQAGIDPQIWFLADRNQLSLIQKDAPAMKPAYGVDFQSPPAVSDLTAAKYQIVNAEYGLSKDWIRQYQNANLWVNLYTIDEPWQYSRLWLLRVNSTTTSNIQAMMDLKAPILSMPVREYIVLWSIVGLACLGIMLWLIIPVYRQRSSIESGT